MGISSLFGLDANAGKDDLNRALSVLNSVKEPSYDDLAYKLQQMVYQGDLTPQQAQAYMQDPTSFNNMQMDPTGKSAQLKALAQLQGISDEGGMTATDRAQMNDIMGQTAQAERGSREAIMQNARERGAGGSGIELANQLINQQGSAQRANQQGLDVAAQAQKRSLDAILQSGNLGGQMQNQEFQQANAKAQAQDAINRFNTQNKQDVSNQNVNTMNAAQQRNLDTKQTLSNQNTGITNDQAKANADVRQQMFDNAITKAGGIAQQYGQLANNANQAVNRDASVTGALIGAGSQIGAAYAGNPAIKKKPGEL